MLWESLLPNLAKPPRLLVSEWAERFRYLSREYAASPGRYDLSIVPYAREPMDCANDRTRIDCAAGSQ